jgi:integrase
MAKQPFKLTQTTVEAAVCSKGKKDVLLFDSVTRGFGLRVSKGGVKTFLAQFRTATGVRRVVIGTFGVLAVEEARRKAKVILGAAADGRDIAAERKAAEAAAVEEAKANAFTFEAMIEQWAVARKADNRASYLAEAVKCCTRNLPGWQKRPARSITAAEATTELHAIKAAKGTTTANRTLSYARAAYSWACDNHKVKVNPLKGIKRPGKEITRERALSKAELRAVWQGAGALSAVSGGYIRVLMLSLQRREEVGSMQWVELADDLSVWTLPGARAKNGRTTIVHLSEPVRTIIQGLPRIEGNPYVFAGRKAGQPIRGFNSAKANLDKVMASAGATIPAWSFHDFRRSGVTTLAKAGFAPHVLDRILNHITGSIQGVAAVYQRHEFLEERQAALDAWAAAVVGQPNATIPQEEPAQIVRSTA